MNIDWILPWVAAPDNVQGLHVIKEGLGLDGFDFANLQSNVLQESDPLLEKTGKVLDALIEHDNVLVATNSMDFQTYCLAQLLPVTWALTLRKRAYSATLVDIYRTLSKLISWEGDFEEDAAKNRLERYSLLMWNHLEVSQKSLPANAGTILALLHRRGRNPRAKTVLDRKRNLAVLFYSGTLGKDRQAIQAIEGLLEPSLGSSLARFVLQDFYIQIAHFKENSRGASRI